MNILITGTAGFIGFHLTNKLLEENLFETVVGLDNLNPYYDVNLKYDRLRELGFFPEKIEYNQIIKSKKNKNFLFTKLDLEDGENVQKLVHEKKIDIICNLAAQAGVRYSLENPKAYITSNISGFLSVLEAGRHSKIKHLVYASSSSVYGLNTQMPFSVSHNVDHPLSLYAASKKSNELMAHSYSHLFSLPTTGLRFFTVYGPWGRPDMSLFLFTKNIIEGKPIDVFNHGDMQRDFTYVADIVQGLLHILPSASRPYEAWDSSSPEPNRSSAPYRIFNIGNSSPIKLMDFIYAIEKHIGKKAIINYLPMQAGDVPRTWADVRDLQAEFDYKPSTLIDDGVREFVNWYRFYYK